jgi:IclR family transcriptional regulator, mhp operon transcriptional activator
MRRSLENRSLDRGLTILESLSMHGASSLQDLHRRTRLPKTTIRRTLGTLIARKIVRRSLADRLYRANVALPIQSGSLSVSEGWLVDRAVPHMIELTRSAGWSCDLHIFERTWSRIIESTRPLSPFFQYERHIDLRVAAFASAGGLAVLGTWPKFDVLGLVHETRDNPNWGLPRLGITSRELLAVLKRAREVRYAARASQYRGETPLANTLNAIACPVFQAGAAIGALALLWPRGFLPPARFAEIHLEKLEKAAAAISADLLQETF